MPLKPQVKAYLKQIAGTRPDGKQMTAESARGGLAVRPPTGPEVAKVEDKLIPVQGGKIPIRLYWPKGKGLFPAAVWFHGGGWVTGSIDMSDAICRYMANEAGCVLVNVDYRLAPEFKFPTPVEDCYAATKWTYDNAKSINVDPKKIAIGGSSAGGNLAAAVALMARDRKGPPLTLQALLYPVIERNFTSKSYVKNAEGLFLTKDMMVLFWKEYLRTEADAEDSYCAPIKAKDLKGLAPAFVITAEYDPLFDEGEAYVARLKKAGVPMKLSRYEGMIHGFVSLWSQLDAGLEATLETAREFKKSFSRE